MSEETMKCDWCNKEFPADARACVESWISAYHPPQDGEEWKGEESTNVTPEEIPKEDWERMKQEMELNDDQLKELLTTGTVSGLGAIVCVECQDASLEDSTTP
jgi:hypothetical protein